MDTVGIRELKARLSHRLKRVRAGRRLLVTERGRTIESIHPVETSRATDWAHALTESGAARWSGGKPIGAPHPVSVAKGRSLSEAVIEDRR